MAHEIVGRTCAAGSGFLALDVSGSTWRALSRCWEQVVDTLGAAHFQAAAKVGPRELTTCPLPCTTQCCGFNISAPPMPFSTTSRTLLAMKMYRMPSVVPTCPTITRRPFSGVLLSMPKSSVPWPSAASATRARARHRSLSHSSWTSCRSGG